MKGTGSPAQLQNHLDLLIETRQDLAEAQKSRTELAERLDRTTEQLERLKKRAAVENQRTADLAVERTQLQVRVRDRDEELRGKAKLLDVRHHIFLCIRYYILYILTRGYRTFKLRWFR